MSVLEKAVAHFGDLEVKQIDVPEWETVVYASPFTMAEKKKLLKFAKDDDLEFLVRALILKATDKKGDLLFDLSDKPTLMHKVDPDVITRVVTAFSASPSVEEMEGN